jgi:arginine exporter protein ArgO
VALVDLGYAAVAVTAGAAVTGLLTGHERQVQLVGAAVLLLVVVRGLLGLRRAGTTTDRAGAEPPAGSPWRVLRRFVALTAVNPLTALYFVVLTAGLGDRLGRPAAGIAFVAGVFAASWAWQLVLAAAGSLTGTRMPPWARTATSLAGYAVVTGYAVHLALG